MKKSIILFLFFSVLFLYSEPDFRNVNWGMTKDEVKKAENALMQDSTSDLILNYKTAFKNDKFNLTYNFNQDNKKLLTASYSIEYSKLNLDSYKAIQDLFIKYKKYFEKEYGNYKKISQQDDLVFYYNNKEYYKIDEMNNDLDFYFTSFSYYNENAKINKTYEQISKGYFYYIKFETNTSIILLKSDGKNFLINYIEKKSYIQINDLYKEKVFENEKQINEEKEKEKLINQNANPNEGGYITDIGFSIYYINTKIYIVISQSVNPNIEPFDITILENKEQIDSLIEFYKNPNTNQIYIKYKPTNDFIIKFLSLSEAIKELNNILKINKDWENSEWNPDRTLKKIN